MRDIQFIQSVVASICRVNVVDGKAYVEQLHGTGFFISKKGHLLTARHVIEKGIADINNKGGFLAFFPKRDDGSGSWCLPLSQWEFARAPFDVAICYTEFQSKTFYRIGPLEVEVWKEIAAIGYPMSVVKQTPETYEVHTRFHRGYIQRIVKPGQLQIGNNPPAFELNFPITQGLSGGPLFIYNQTHDFLIGICVGSIESRVVAYENVDIQDGDVRLREQTVRVEEFGIAHDMRSLLDWKPRILNGQSLVELSNETWAA
jgi:hypothetical protein